MAVNQRTCSNPDCEKAIKADNKSGLCRGHRWPKGRTCSITECSSEVFGHGWCQKHYNRWRDNGNPENLTIIRGNDAARIARYIDKSDDCWNWNGLLNANGYGSIRVGTMKLAHRVVFEMETGIVLGDAYLDHICHNIKCVRPAHLRPVTPKQNSEHQLGASKNSKTGVRGVYIEARGNSVRYRAAVRHNRKVHTVGSFETLEEAESAVVSKRLELFTHNDQDRMARTNQGENNE